MRKITRRLTAAVLSACLALAPFGAFAESPQGIMAQVVLPMQDGTQMTLPVQTVITSAGETVYWLDMSMLDEAQIEALSMGELVLFDEAGELVGYLMQNLTVVMTLEGVQADTARRLLDFMSGIAFALQGKITPVSAKTYFVTPQNVDILGTASEQPENSGAFF